MVAKSARPSRMNPATRALCFGYRNPPPGQKKLPFWKIGELLGYSEGAVRECVNTFSDVKSKRGRKTGWRKTTKAEDKVIMEKFHKVRPPGQQLLSPRGGLAAGQLALQSPRARPTAIGCGVLGGN